MIKFVIGFIGLVFVGLSVYVYIGKKNEESTKSTVTQKVSKQEVTKHESVEVAKEVNITNAENKYAKESNIQSISSNVENYLSRKLKYEPNAHRSAKEFLSIDERQNFEPEIQKHTEIRFSLNQIKQIQSIGKNVKNSVKSNYSSNSRITEQEHREIMKNLDLPSPKMINNEDYDFAKIAESFK